MIVRTPTPDVYFYDSVVYITHTIKYNDTLIFR